MDKNVYSQGAENGVMVGLYLTAVSMLMFYGTASGLLSLLSVLMLLGCPALLYVIERRYQRACGGCADVPPPESCFHKNSLLFPPANADRFRRIPCFCAVLSGFRRFFARKAIFIYYIRASPKKQGTKADAPPRPLRHRLSKSRSAQKRAGR